MINPLYYNQERRWKDRATDRKRIDCCIDRHTVQIYILWKGMVTYMSEEKSMKDYESDLERSFQVLREGDILDVTVIGV